MTSVKKIYLGKSAIQGQGIFASNNIEKEERICYIKGKRVNKLPKTTEESLSIPTWFGMSRKLWIDPEDTIFRYLNHSCEPNAAIIGTRTLVAIQKIEEGEEIIIDYSMTDVDPLWYMDCKCKSKLCRKKIRSIHSISTETFTRYMPYIPRYFQRVYFRNYIQSRLKSKQ